MVMVRVMVNYMIMIWVQGYGKDNGKRQGYGSVMVMGTVRDKIMVRVMDRDRVMVR